MKAGLYAHVPFCFRKCDYCAFHSVADWTTAGQQRIVQKMAADARLFATALRPNDAPRAFTSLYIGGGTPSALWRHGILALVERLLPLVSSGAEISVEVNPDSVDGSLIEDLGRCGATRLSVGVQTLNEKLCNELGRLPTTVKTLEWIRSSWPNSLSADLIVGIPGQQTRNALMDIESIHSLGFDHISLYDLTIEESTALWERTGRLPGSEIDWIRIRDEVERCGYVRYEVSNFARPGHECKHNLGYWKAFPYVGVGPSAASTVELDGGFVRLVQATSHDRYLHSHPINDAQAESLGLNERYTEFIMLGLRTAEGLDRRRTVELFGPDAWRSLIKAAQGLNRDWVAEIGPDILRCSDRGLDLLNRVLPQLLSATKLDTC